MLPGQNTKIEIPLVSKLKEGELAVVLTWTQGANVLSNHNVNLQNLDLHVEFQPSDSVICRVDYLMRQCNGVQLTGDNYLVDNKYTTM